MADVQSVIGARIRITTREGSYEGTVHSLDQQNRKLTLTKVELCSSGKKLHGFHNFFGDELNDVLVIEQETISPEKNTERQVTAGIKESNTNSVKAPTSSAVQRSDPSPQGLRKGVSQSVGYERGKAGFGRGRGLLDKAFADAGITYKPGSNKQFKPGRVIRDASDGETSLLPREPVAPSKYLDSHFEDGQDDDDILINDDGAALRDPPQVIMLDTFGNKFENAVKFISSQRVIGVGCEGVNLGRFGKLCLIVVGCRQFIYIFDIVSLGASCFDEGLTDILEDGNILKVFHDCRQPSDILCHHYGVQLVNVFDTQVADVLIYRNETGGEMPRCVNPLVPCLYEYLNLSSEQCHFQKVRKKYMQNNAAIWEERPLPEKLMNATAKHVMYLRDLRVVQMERLMAEFLFGVDIYLKVVRDAAPSRKQSKPQFLPSEFKKLNSFKVRQKRRPYDNEYLDDVPSIVGSSNSVWNDGAQFAEKYQNKPGRVKEHVNDEFDVSLAAKAMENYQSASDSENSVKETDSEPIIHNSGELTKPYHGSNGIDFDGKQLHRGTEQHLNYLKNENIKTKGYEFSVAPNSEMEHYGNVSEGNTLPGDHLRQNCHPVPSNGSKNSNVDIKKSNGCSVMFSGTPTARAIFSENDFPPLSSSDSECGTTPPKHSPQRPSNNRETARSPLTLPVYRNTKMSPQPPRSFAGVKYSGPIGRGRAQNLLSNMAQPPARLPAEDKPIDFRTLKMRGVKFSFPEDDELLAASEVVPVSDAGCVSGTRVHLRET